MLHCSAPTTPDCLHHKAPTSAQSQKYELVYFVDSPSPLSWNHSPDLEHQHVGDATHTGLPTLLFTVSACWYGVRSVGKHLRYARWQRGGGGVVNWGGRINCEKLREIAGKLREIVGKFGKLRGNCGELQENCGKLRESCDFVSNPP